MPLTFAHPAAILPFSRKSRFVNFSAMVLGSMAPDFEYFLRGQPLGEFGHTFYGFLFLNLPLVTLVYFLYHFFVHHVLVNHLPLYLQDASLNKIENSKMLLSVFVFCYSALFGMITHVVWDSFTHLDGYMVINFSIFTHTYHLYGFSIPLYKILQHGSTLFGMTMIIGYMYVRGRFSSSNSYSDVHTKQKLYFWYSLLFFTILITGIWYLIDYISIFRYGIVVVRLIDSFFISLLILSLAIKYQGLTLERAA